MHTKSNSKSKARKLMSTVSMRHFCQQSLTLLDNCKCATFNNAQNGTDQRADVATAGVSEGGRSAPAAVPTAMSASQQQVHTNFRQGKHMRLKSATNKWRRTAGIGKLGDATTPADLCDYKWCFD